MTWQDCQSALERFGMQLPTEFQWEDAARAGAPGPWPTLTRSDLARLANLSDRAAASEHDVPVFDDWEPTLARVSRFGANGYGERLVVQECFSSTRESLRRPAWPTAYGAVA